MGHWELGSWGPRQSASNWARIWTSLRPCWLFLLPQLEHPARPGHSSSDIFPQDVSRLDFSHLLLHQRSL